MEDAKSCKLPAVNGFGIKVQKKCCTPGTDRDSRANFTLTRSEEKQNLLMQAPACQPLQPPIATGRKQLPVTLEGINEVSKPVGRVPP